MKGKRNESKEGGPEQGSRLSVDGVKGAINKILKHNGCILADSAGLGKTFEALAVKGITPKQAEGYRAAIPKAKWQEWEVPFDTDPDWPKPLQEALTAYRAAWRAKMDEVNACIAANAEMEELVDKPEMVRGVVRVSGPFTMEGVIAVEDRLDTPIGGAPEELESFGNTDAAGLAVANAEPRLDKIMRLLKASGVTGQSAGGRRRRRGRRICRLERLEEPALPAPGAVEEG